LQSTSQVTAPSTKQVVTTLNHINIGMNVLSTVRFDVRVLREATALRDAGYAVSIVDIEGANNQPVKERIHGLDVRHVLVSNSFLTTRFAHWSLVRAIKILVRSTFHLMSIPADIYHAHDVSGLFPCYIAALLRRKPLILDAHELPLNAMSIQSSWLLKLLPFLITGIMPRCAKVITVSSPIAQEIRKRYHRQEISVIRNVPAYQPGLKSNRLRQYLGLNPRTRIALFQGYLKNDRGLENLIKSAQFLEKDIVIVIMGKAFGVILTQLEALIEYEGVADRVKIIPPVPYEELLEWTASADIGLILYRPDVSKNIQLCLPNKFFEYLMAGLPVLTSQLDAVADIVKTYGVGQVVSSITPEEIGKAINDMAANCTAYEQMRLNALEVAQNELCWEKEKQRLLELYHEILEK